MKMLTVREAAAILSVSAATVYGLCTLRRLRHERIGLGRGVIRIPEDAIDEYRRAHAVEAEAGSRAETPAPRREPVRLQHLRLKPS